jgi:hypothetical protein
MQAQAALAATGAPGTTAPALDSNGIISGAAQGHATGSSTNGNATATQQRQQQQPEPDERDGDPTRCPGRCCVVTRDSSGEEIPGALLASPAQCNGAYLTRDALVDHHFSASSLDLWDRWSSDVRQWQTTNFPGRSGHVPSLQHSQVSDEGSGGGGGDSGAGGSAGEQLGVTAICGGESTWEIPLFDGEVITSVAASALTAAERAESLMLQGSAGTIYRCVVYCIIVMLLLCCFVESAA